MKNLSNEEFEQCRIEGCDTCRLISYCLNRLCDEEKRYSYQSAVRGLTYEDIIFALMAARDEIESLRGGQ